MAENRESTYFKSVTSKGLVRYTIDIKTDTMQQLRTLAERRHSSVSGLMRLGVDMLLQDEELKLNPNITPAQRLTLLILATI